MGQNPELLAQASFTAVNEERAKALAEATATLAMAAFAHRRNPSAGLRITLDGQLGAGKTTFARYFLRSLGIAGRIKSPSFSIVESYVSPNGTPLHHFDFYRQSDPAAWQGGGLRDLMTEAAITLAEWPEKARGLPPAHIAVSIGWQGDAAGDAPRNVDVAFFDCHDGITLAPDLERWQQA